MDYFTALRRTGKILDSYFEQSKDILHNGSKGFVREDILDKVIRPFLPFCYGLCGGEAFDSEGNMSKQLDLVVYDTLYSYTVPYSQNFIQFPCESIYGIIEIKSELNKQEFDIAIENIKSLKCLKRESSNPLTITPKAQVSIHSISDEDKRNRYFGIIFAYKSVGVKKVMSYLSTLNNIPSAYRPNAIVLYDKKTIILQAKDRCIDINQQDDFNQYFALNCGDDILAVFIGLLINYTGNTQLKKADISKATKSALQEILKQNYDAGNIQSVEFKEIE